MTHDLVITADDKVIARGGTIGGIGFQHECYHPTFETVSFDVDRDTPNPLVMLLRAAADYFADGQHEYNDVVAMRYTQTDRGTTRLSLDTIVY
jgi:hypothetical protein